MGYSGSVYEKLGDSSPHNVFFEGKGYGTSCMVYPEIYHFNKKTELTNKKISDTVDMLNSSAGSYKDLSYDMQQAYSLVYSLNNLLNNPYKEVFDEDENFLLIPRIESKDSCGNSEIISFYEKKCLEDEEIVSKLPQILERRHQHQTTEEQLKSARRYSCCQIESIKIFSAFNEICDREEIDKFWDDILNIKTKCDILRITGKMHKCINLLKEEYDKRYVLATQVTNLLYHYRNKIKNGTKVFVSYYNETLVFCCEGEEKISVPMPYTKSFLFTMLFGNWAGSGANFSTKKELEEFIEIFKYIPKKNKNFRIESYFKDFFKKVDENDLYDGQPFTISISGGY